ncbi:DUF6428 family protein [Luteirhabdus pelagi]|uniref:DUF6428 family protein n=1 Tax=Luteirhabdus pelagi TaxID=2792783 RepID=UPI00193AC4A6|nr:DUF6428 family protein [Luteirhabdus pelagi]
MTLEDIKQNLSHLDTITFSLPSGVLVPEHFHVTEIGHVKKKFIDCGGTLREEEKINFQLWSANDYNHRLHPEKLVNIINLSIEKLGLPTDAAIEVEYQGNTIETYGLEFADGSFQLVSTQTDCLAKDACGIPEKKEKRALSSIQAEPCCSPSSNCC